MRGTIAKRLRRKVLGEGYSIRGRQYTTDDKGAVHCKGKRPEYQLAKKEKKNAKTRRP